MPASQSPQRVDGEVIHSSRLKIFGLLALFALLLLFGIGLVAIRLIEGRFSIVGAGIAVGSGVFLGCCSLLLFSPTSLVIGKDRFQTVKGESQVLGQIPYRNISEMKVFKDGSFSQLGIHLADPEDHETIWPGGAETFAASRNESGYDLCLWGYLVSEEAILEKLRKRIRDSQRA